MVKLTSVLLLLFTLVRHSEAAVNDVHFDHITVDQGLSQNNVTAIFQDHAGFMWFGTIDGLNKYDGYDFTIYRHNPLDKTSLSFGGVGPIYEDSQGLFWVGTDRSLDRLDRNTDTFRHYPVGPVNTIYEDSRGNLWLASTTGLFKYDREKDDFTTYDKTPAAIVLCISAICEDPDRSKRVLWFGTEEGLYQLDLDTGQFNRFQHNPQDPRTLRANQVRRVCTDSTGQLWLGTRGGGLNYYDRLKKQFGHYEHEPGNPNSLSDNDIRDLVYIKETHSLWIATKRGINRFEISTKQFTRYLNDVDDPNSLSDDEVRTIYRDRCGTFWAGTKHGGINKFNPDRINFQYYKQELNNPNSLISSQVWAIQEDRSGSVWIGTDRGLSAMLFSVNGTENQPPRFINYAPNSDDPYSIPRTKIKTLFADRDGNLWIGTLGAGLVRFDKNTQTFIRYPTQPLDANALPILNIYSIYQDRVGTIWVGANGAGLNKLLQAHKQDVLDPDKVSFKQYLFPEDTGTISNQGWIIDIYEDPSGKLYLGTWANGLVVFDPNKETATFFHHDPANPESISDNGVLAIHEDKKGMLWLGTYGGGLNKLVPQKNTAFSPTGQAQVQFEHFIMKDGLPNNVVYGILEDDYGYLWLSTNMGVSRFDPVTETFRNYDAQDGLQGNEFNLGADYRRRNGEMLFGGPNGLNAFFPEATINPHPPQIVITGFKKFGKRVHFERPLPKIGEIELSYRENFFSFEFVALHYKDPADNKYAYKLEGYDKDWVYAGQNREAIYTNVGPGDYRFRVKAANCDGIWNEDSIPVQLKIVPPFWQAKWFFGLAVLILISLVVSFHQYRLRQALRIESAKNEEREIIGRKIAADFHDELGHRVTKISLISNLLRQQLQNTSPTVQANLEKITDNADALFKEVKEFIWQLDPEKDTAYELAVQLKNFSDELFDHTRIAFELDIDSKQLENVSLPMDWRQHLLRMFKEAMHNVLKHAGDCSKVLLKVEIQDGFLKVTLINDGKDFEISHPDSESGLKNMRQRAQNMGGEIRITSDVNGGTRVEFVAKLP